MPILAKIAIVAFFVVLIIILWRAIRFKNPACDDIEEESRNPDF